MAPKRNYIVERSVEPRENDAPSGEKKIYGNNINMVNQKDLIEIAVDTGVLAVANAVTSRPYSGKYLLKFALADTLDEYVLDEFIKGIVGSKVEGQTDAISKFLGAGTARVIVNMITGGKANAMNAFIDSAIVAVASPWVRDSLPTIPGKAGE